MKKIAVVILAAGKSTRMGSIKQLEEINGKPLLEIVLEKVKNLKKNSFCVLGANANLIKKNIDFDSIKIIENQNFEKGLSTSITTSIQYFNKKSLTFDGVLFLLADQPAVEVSYLKAMIATFNAENSKIVASNYNDVPGIPAIFPNSFFNSLLYITGDKGAKEILIKSKKSVILESQQTNLIDLDTKEDITTYQKQKKKNIL